MKIVYLIILSIVGLQLNSCNAQIQNQMNTKKREIFDITAYKKRKEKKRSTYFLKDSTKIIEFDTRGEGVHKIYIQNIIPASPEAIGSYKVFNYGGEFIFGGAKYFNEFNVGIWKRYDEQGNLIEETDYDKPYLFTFEQVLAWIKKREIDMTSYDFEIYRGANEKGSSWTVTWEKEDKSGLRRVFLDGTTGEIIEEFDEDYPEEE